MLEWVKDNNEECGWKRITYEGKDVVEGETADGVPALPEDTEMEA